MTVTELHARLTELIAEGHGDLLVVTYEGEYGYEIATDTSVVNISHVWDDNLELIREPRWYVRLF